MVDRGDDPEHTDDREDAADPEGIDPSDEPGGPIAWMTRNSVAANLLMFVILFGGILGIFRTKVEVFPEFSLDAVQVRVPYPGAGPEDTEQGITLAVEEAVRGIEGVKRVTSSSDEGVAAVTIETLVGADPQQVYDDVKAAVDRITTFPERAERPQVTLLDPPREVISLVLAGDLSRNALQDLAEDAEDALIATDAISKVEIVGLPPVELSIEVPRERLRALGLSLPQVAAQVRASSVDLPAGEVETDGGEVLLRVDDDKRSVEALQDVVIRGTQGGAIVRLSDIATITDTFQDIDQESFYDGQPAVRVTAFRVGDETPLAVAQAVKDHASHLDATLPDTVTVTTWNDDSEILRARIGLLLKNGAMGLVLVLVLLTLFLDLRLAFWVSLGIPISFLGAFLLMPLFGISINMITLFAFIVTLGLVVDDAIVVGENTFSYIEEGHSPLEAATRGAREMAVPVTFAILTSCAAFAPMFFVPGTIGKIFALLPSVVVLVLLFSLIESFFVLPAHLAHSAQSTPRFLSWLAALRERVASALQRFTDGPYERFVRFCIRGRYATVAAALGLLVATSGLVFGQLVPFQFFPAIDGDIVTAQAEMPFGTHLDRTREVSERLQVAAEDAAEQLGGDAVIGQFTRLGFTPAEGPGDGWTGSHVTTVQVELVGGGERDFTSKEFAATWRSAFDAPAGLDSLRIESSAGPSGGSAIDVQLAHPEPAVLDEASAQVADALRDYADLTNVENSWAQGKPQLDYTLRPGAETLGLSTQDVAQQLRGAFYGSEAYREQRDENEIRVMVRLPEEQRASLGDVERYRIRTPDGTSVPLDTVATFETGSSPTSIQREDGRRVTNVRADLAEGVSSNQTVKGALREDIFPKLREQFGGLQIELVGQQRSQAEALSSLGPNFALALFVVFALLAVPFRSYTQPVVVMAAIPFGLVGAVVGHLAMGFSLSIISMFGVIALSGVVVNDSLVLVDATNTFRRAGESAQEAVVAGGKRRLRPILLTSLTTFLGLAPMILETSLQARFLIPMALSLGFGVLGATFIALLLVPALYVIDDDLHRGIATVKDWMFASSDSDAPDAAHTTG